MKNNKILKIAIIVVLIITIFDQLTKFLIIKYIPDRIGNEYFAIETVQNTGMAFGFNSGNTKNIVLTIFVICVIVSFMKNQKEAIDTKTAIAVSMLLGGGISNLIDRFIRGGILDFVKILFIPNFNLADISICVGWVLIVIFLIKYTRKDEVIKEEK